MEAQAVNVSRPTPGIVVRAVLRIVATITAVFVLYALMPGTRNLTTASVAVFVVVLAGFAMLIALEVRSILHAAQPAIRAFQAIAVIAPIFLVIFAITYLGLSHSNGQNFNQPLDHISAIYFTLVTFATVGYGDIVAKTDGARLAVMVQIFLDIVFIGVIVRLLVGAVQRRIGRPNQ